RHITTQKQTEIMLLAQTQILEMIAHVEPLETILTKVTSLIEQQLNGIYASILLLDETGHHFETVISATIPEEYGQLLSASRLATMSAPAALPVSARNLLLSRILRPARYGRLFARLSSPMASDPAGRLPFFLPVACLWAVLRFTRRR